MLKPADQKQARELMRACLLHQLQLWDAMRAIEVFIGDLAEIPGGVAEVDDNKLHDSAISIKTPGDTYSLTDKELDDVIEHVMVYPND